MKKQKINFENLKITEFYWLEKYIDKMMNSALKNEDFEVYYDFKAIKRGLSISKDFIKYRIKEFQKNINPKNSADEPWRNAIIILKGMIRTDITNERKK